MSTLKNIVDYLRSHRRIWIGPIIAMFVIMGILFAISVVARIIPVVVGMM